MTLVFNLILDKVIQNADTQKSILNQSRHICDKVKIAWAKNTLEEEFFKLEHEAPKVGLIINYEKTKYMSRTRSGDKPSEITLAGKRFDAVQDFKYFKVMRSNRDHFSYK